MKLSNNFSLEECLYSDTANKDIKLKNIQENPPEYIIENLKYVVNKAAQPIRNIIKYPIKISSGWRSPELNKKIKGSKNSQHLIGEALDLQLKDHYLIDDNTLAARERINLLVNKYTGKNIKDNVNANFYLFAIACLNMEAFDADQIIHEFGENGKPAWLHISASQRQNKREILIINKNGTKRLSLKEALELGI